MNEPVAGQKCHWCDRYAVTRIIHGEDRGWQPVCQQHLDQFEQPGSRIARPTGTTPGSDYYLGGFHSEDKDYEVETNE